MRNEPRAFLDPLDGLGDQLARVCSLWIGGKTMTFEWWSTPRGVMRYIGPVAGKEPTSSYRDKEGRERFFHDADCKPTKEPTWYKRQSKGLSAKEAKKQARQKAVAI